VHDNASDILITGNLYANNMQRNPLFKGGARGAVINNFIYNPGNAAVHFGLVPEEWEGHEWLTGAMVVEGNYLLAGPDTRKSLAPGSFRGPADVYWKNNFTEPASAWKELSGSFSLLNDRPFWPEGFKALAPAQAKGNVLENAGAFFWDRDQIDQRIIEDVKNGTGKIIDSEQEVGGYPVWKPVFRTFNPEEWDLTTLEKRH
jgi:hypothetical protein